MPRKEQYADGSYSGETKAKIRSLAASVNAAGLAGFEGDSDGAKGCPSVGIEELGAWASARNDGWVRIVPSVEGGASWKWRFTSGPWVGHYVFYRQTYYQTTSEGFNGLAEKARAVDEGRLRPSPDVY